jgi:Amt family ammonium transporter
MLGTFLTGVFAAEVFGGSGYGEGGTMGGQVMVQLAGIGATVVWCAALTWLSLKLVGLLVGLRVTQDRETQGLDLSEHDERGYIL